MTSSMHEGRPPRLSAVVLFFSLVFTALLFAVPAFSEDRLEDSMKEVASKKEKVTIQADNIKYDRKTNIYTAHGNVRISQGDTILTSDDATLNEETGDAEARGKAQLVTATNVVFADTMKVNFDTKLGVLEKGYILVMKENYHVTGDKLDRVNENEYVVTKGALTTCDAETPAWLVTADSMDIRMDRYVTAKNVVFRIKGIPVFYTPYAWFPLLKPRTSGFLIPGAGYSTKQGFRFFDSYYWAPLDNFDTTLSLDYRSKRGLGVSDQIRYAMNKDTDLDFYGYFMDDRLDKTDHYNIRLKYREVFTNDIFGKVDINLSDSQFYRQLSETTLERTQRSLDSNAFLTDNLGWGRAYFFSQYTESLDFFNSSHIVERLPEIGANILKKQVKDLPLYLDADASGTYFYKETGVDGERADGNVRASSYFNLDGINFSPRVGIRETGYDLQGSGSSAFDDSRGLFGAGMKMQTGLYRLYTFSGGPFEGIRHTVEPVVAYNYVFDDGGGNLPKFDGVDTYGRRNQLAYSLSNRFVIKFRKTKRVDFLTIKLSQFYDFFGETSLTGQRRTFSPLYGEISYEAGRNIKINNNFRYDYYKGGILSVNNDLFYRADMDRWYICIGQRYSTDTEQVFMSPSQFDFFTPNTDFVSDFVVTSTTKEENIVNFLTFDGGVKISQDWSVNGKVWYDVHTQNLLETTVNVIYTSQCWSLTGNYVKRPGETQVMVFFNLKGIGNIKL